MAQSYIPLNQTDSRTLSNAYSGSHHRRGVPGEPGIGPGAGGDQDRGRGEGREGDGCEGVWV